MDEEERFGDVNGQRELKEERKEKGQSNHLTRQRGWQAKLQWGFVARRVAEALLGWWGGRRTPT